MSELEIRNLNFADKVLFLDEYLSKFTKDDIKQGKGVLKDKIDEDELIELDEEFDDGKLTVNLEKAAKNIAKKLNFDGKGNISNEELAAFEEILEKIGLKPSEIVAILEEYGIKTESNVTTLKSSELDGVNLNEFKKVIDSYPVLKEIISEAGYDKIFDILDKDNSGFLDNNETGFKITLEDIKTLLKENGIDFVDTKTAVKESIKENESFQNMLKELKQVLNIQDKKDTDKGMGVEETSSQNTSIPTGENYFSSNQNYSAPSVSNFTPAGNVTTELVPITTTTYTYEVVENEEAKKLLESVNKQIDELTGKKADAETKVKSEKEALYAIQNDEEESIKAKKEEADELEGKYKELLNSNAESDPVVAGYKKDLEENEKAIKENADMIVEEENNLININGEISNQESLINSLKSSKGALQQSLSSAKSIKLTDENREQVQNKIAYLNEQIKEKEDEIIQQVLKLQQLKTQKDEIEEKIGQLNETKTSLEEKRTEIENNIEQSADKATKDALSAYKEARENYTALKNEMLAEAKNNIEKAQNEVAKIQTELDELEAKKIETENDVNNVQYKKVPHTTTTYKEVQSYSPSAKPANTSFLSAAPAPSVQKTSSTQSQAPVQTVQKVGQQGTIANYNAQRGAALAQAARSLYGGVKKGNSLCATGVSQAINKAFGYRTHGNGCDYGNTLSALNDWVEITDQVHTVEDLKKLPAGCVVSWSAYNTQSLGRLYGHVYITDGYGKGISDFEETIGSYYLDRNSKFRVFAPI